MTTPTYLSSSDDNNKGGERPLPRPPQNSMSEQLSEQSRKAIHDFFYPSSSPPPRRLSSCNSFSDEVAAQASSSENSNHTNEVRNEETRLFVEQFWKYYDDIIILSIFTQLGIIFRLAASNWVKTFGGTFKADSALFVNLPLNCLSCFLLGAMSSGSDIMSIIETRFTPTKRQREVETDDISNEAVTPRLKRLRRRKRNRIHSQQKNKNSDAELRQVQLLALERRIRASPSLLLFPVGREEADLMEHYFEDGYRRDRNDKNGENDTTLMVELSEYDDSDDDSEQGHSHNSTPTGNHAPPNNPQIIDYGTQGERDLDQIIYDVSVEFAGHVQEEARNLGSNLQRLSHATLQDGWDVGTTPEAMSEDLLLGLRDGFCGALSSFSSWNSSMVTLIRHGSIQEALVGYALGIQLPIIAYQFGQHIAVYIFVWRCKREVRTDERRGYGIQLTQEEDDDLQFKMDGSGAITGHSSHSSASKRQQLTDEEGTGRQLPSVRAVATAFFVLAFVAQFTSLFFYNDGKDQLIALSLLFSPFGVLTRWRLSRYNGVQQGFPFGTFTCNLLACALSGSLGTLLAGNPGPEERIVLVAFISGFGGTLSSVAQFIVEILNGVDPLLFKWNGFYYALCTIFWGFVIGLVSTSSVDWADEVSGK